MYFFEYKLLQTNKLMIKVIVIIEKESGRASFLFSHDRQMIVQF